MIGEDDTPDANTSFNVQVTGWRRKQKHRDYTQNPIHSSPGAILASKRLRSNKKSRAGTAALRRTLGQKNFLFQPSSVSMKQCQKPLDRRMR